MLVQPDDLTGKARIRQAALELFAADGVAGTSMRSVAAKASVSPSLVVHHFRSKALLREAVDGALVHAFRAALGAVDTTVPPDEVGRQLEMQIFALIGGNRVVRDYLARTLLEASPASHRLFDSLMEVVDSAMDTLERSGYLAPGLDPTWRSYTAVFVVLGSVLLSRQIEARLGADPFDAEMSQARSACNVAILQHGLFRQR